MAVCRTRCTSGLGQSVLCIPQENEQAVAVGVLYLKALAGHLNLPLSSSVVAVISCSGGATTSNSVLALE